MNALWSSFPAWGWTLAGGIVLFAALIAAALFVQHRRYRDFARWCDDDDPPTGVGA